MLRYVAVITALIIWGSAGILGRYLALPSLLIVTYRVLFGAGALGLVNGVLRSSGSLSGRPTRQRWPLIILSGLCLALNWVFFFQAIATTEVVNAVLAYYTAPVWVAATAPFLFKERLERKTLVAAVVAGLGLFLVLSGPGAQLGPGELAGIGWGLLAALFYAGVTLFGRLLRDLSPVLLVLWQCLSAAAVLLPVLLLTAGAGALRLDPLPLLLLAILGVIHTAGALVLYFWGLAGVKVQHLAVLSYLDPVAAVLFAFLFLGERPTGMVLLGGVLILGASLLLTIRKPNPNAAA
ncbi:MAG TPA: DMT family transporter [Symbiobacteriaceae bacterium]|nr:DMT family transporter [Symbiobacteriaceae bacterium]